MSGSSAIVIASSNPGKLQEFVSLLPKEYSLKMQSDFNVPTIEESGESFIENAILKARNACHYTHIAALADDSGLEVDALNGKPGVYSARYAGLHTTDRANVEKLLQDLRHVPWQQRTARFHCAIAYLRHAEDPRPLICEGTWHGLIQESPSGSNGFGYDPVFYVPTHQCSAAELDAETKNRLSHRGQALTKLLAVLEQTTPVCNPV